MKRMLSKKSHSWWWDSHISRKNSKWLADNLEKMDLSVKEMLKLIEGEGDSFAKKAEMYYEKRPSLISYVEEFYRMYRALAERYDQVTGDLRKNVESEIKSQISGNGSDLVSDPPSPSSGNSAELTPDSKLQQPKTNPKAAGYDFFLASGGSSDLSRKDSDGSFSPSESDLEPDLDDINEENGNSISSMLQQRIQELENELREAREKLNAEEQKNYHDQCKLNIESLEEDLSAANEKLHSAETDILDLKKKLENTSASLDTKIRESNLENKKVSDLEEDTLKLQEQILVLKNETEILKGLAESSAKQFEAELLSRDFIIEEFKIELVNAAEIFGQEKSVLEAAISDLEGVNVGLRAEVEKIWQEKLLLEACVSELENRIQELNASNTLSVDRISKEKSALEAELLTLSQSNTLLEAKVIVLDNQTRQLEAERLRECDDKQKLITALNGHLDDLKLKFDMLRAEKEEVSSKVDSLLNGIKSRDDHNQQLHHENAKLIMQIEETTEASSNLKWRLKELEDMVERQKVVIWDGAEGKREAIRQLCFSLEHYRDGYIQLRELLKGHKRSAIAVRC